jgi:spermidine synthase
VPERETQVELLVSARGHVLIGGLGLGLVIKPLLADPDVWSVTVLDKNPQVYKIMEPYLATWRGRQKLKVVIKDAAKWKPLASDIQLFDTIYMDIWPTVTAMNIPSMVRLRKHYKPFLTEGGFYGNWAESECFRLAKLACIEHGKDEEMVKAFEDLERQFGPKANVHMCSIPETVA